LSDPCEIYQRGADKLDDILDWCAELRIPAVTLWVLSTGNLRTHAVRGWGRVVSGYFNYHAVPGFIAHLIRTSMARNAKQINAPSWR
jgi:hypothetical protein